MHKEKQDVGMGLDGFLSLSGHLLVPSLFHEVTSLHLLHFREIIFPPVFPVIMQCLKLLRSLVLGPYQIESIPEILRCLGRDMFLNGRFDAGAGTFCKFFTFTIIKRPTGEHLHHNGWIQFV